MRGPTTCYHRRGVRPDRSRGCVGILNSAPGWCRPGARRGRPAGSPAAALVRHLDGALVPAARRHRRAAPARHRLRGAVRVGRRHATLDVSAFTFLQRRVRSADRMAVFVLVEAIAAPASPSGRPGPIPSATSADHGALVVARATMPVAIIATGSRVRRVDEEQRRRRKSCRSCAGPDVCRSPFTALQPLARACASVVYAPTSDIVREGENGDAYLIVDSGRVEVSQGGRAVNELGPGEGSRDRAASCGAPDGHRQGHGPTTMDSITWDDFDEAIAVDISAVVAELGRCRRPGWNPTGRVTRRSLLASLMSRAGTSVEPRVIVVGHGPELEVAAGAREVPSPAARRRTSPSAWSRARRAGPLEPVPGIDFLCPTAQCGGNGVERGSETRTSTCATALLPLMGLVSRTSM